LNNLVAKFEFPEDAEAEFYYVNNLGALISRGSKAAERSREVPAVENIFFFFVKKGG